MRVPTLSFHRLGGLLILGGLCVVVYMALTQVLQTGPFIAAGAVSIILGFALLGTDGPDSTDDSPPSAEDLE